MCRGPVARWDPMMLAPLLVAGALWVAAPGADRLVLLIALVGPASLPSLPTIPTLHCTLSCPRHNAQKAKA